MRRHHLLKDIPLNIDSESQKKAVLIIVWGQTCKNEIRHKLLFLTGTYRFETKFLTNYKSCITGIIH